MPCFQVTISKNFGSRFALAFLNYYFRRGGVIQTIFKGLLKKEFTQERASNALFSGNDIEKIRLALRARIFIL